MTLLRSVLLLILALLAWPAAAQAPSAPNSSSGILVVATHEAPPFAMKRPLSFLFLMTFADLWTR